MTLKLNKLFLTFSFRYGFGFDIEACDSRPVYMYENDELLPAVFDGIVLLIPFITLSLGSVFLIEVIENEQ